MCCNGNVVFDALFGQTSAVWNFAPYINGYFKPEFSFFCLQLKSVVHFVSIYQRNISNSCSFLVLKSNVRYFLEYDSHCT